MASDNEALWVVELIPDNYSLTTRRKLFRTREAARQFIKDKKSRPHKTIYSGPFRASWGPEQ